MFHRGDGRTVLEGSKCEHSHPATPKSRARAQQPVRSRVSSWGRWRTCLGKGRRRAHISRFVRIHVGVGQCCRAVDVESRALQAKNRKRDIPSGRWRKCLGRFKMQALTYCNAKVMSTRATAGQFKGQFKGAMEEMPQTVQNANTHILQRQNHEHAHSSRSVQGSSMGRWNVTHGFDLRESSQPARQCT